MNHNFKALPCHLTPFSFEYKEKIEQQNLRALEWFHTRRVYVVLHDCPEDEHDGSGMSYITSLPRQLWNNNVSLSEIAFSLSVVVVAVV